MLNKKKRERFENGPVKVLNPVEVFWNDVKQAAHSQNPCPAEFK